MICDIDVASVPLCFVHEQYLSALAKDDPLGLRHWPGSHPPYPGRVLALSECNRRRAVLQRQRQTDLRNINLLGSRS
jgi:hypothetical protein